jgi:light-harvesting protein B-800-850 alpha chain
MNNAKMWLVVKPTVGVPLFLSAVAIGSFAVHVAVLTNTGWVGDFLTGRGINAQKSASIVLPDTGTQQAQLVLPDGQKF